MCLRAGPFGITISHWAGLLQFGVGLEVTHNLLERQNVILVVSEEGMFQALARLARTIGKRGIKPVHLRMSSPKPAPSRNVFQRCAPNRESGTRMNLIVDVPDMVDRDSR